MTFSKIRLHGTTGVKLSRGNGLSDIAICNIVSDAMPALQVFEVGALVEDDTPFYDLLNFPIETAGIPALEALNRLNDYQTSIYTWTSAPYRKLCADLGLDPDEGRTQFFEGYETLGNKLLLRLADFTETQPTEAARNAIRALVFALHRTDKRLGTSIIEHTCNQITETDRDQNLIMNSLRAVQSLWGIKDIEVTFLPDRQFQKAVFRPKGLKPSTDLSMVNWDEQCYWNTDGIAVRPEHPSIIEELVLRKLEEDFGVCVVLPGTARTYMRDEGAYYARKFADLAMPEDFPAQHVSLWRYLNWLRRREGLSAMLRVARTFIFQTA
ncbi:hypothetical protein WG622_17205 [Cognatishimia sp. D5M38]|uniref:Uncharacterized protein n=1 Tax=Cognatishimia coralii TaxID=3083254 RepID=A0ABU8QKN5_9RHOB|nr:hypothetical protein [Donghicola eburneus]MCI5040746.1 hypothetical protein [Donghicola eburneus]